MKRTKRENAIERAKVEVHQAVYGSVDVAGRSAPTREVSIQKRVDKDRGKLRKAIGNVVIFRKWAARDLMVARKNEKKANRLISEANTIRQKHDRNKRRIK